MSEDNGTEIVKPEYVPDKDPEAKSGTDQYPRVERRSIVTVIAFVFNIILYLFIGLIWINVIPKFGKMYEEMGMPLLKHTSILVSIPWYVYLIIILAIILILVIIQIKVKSKDKKNWIYLIAIIIGVLIIGLTAISLFFPVVNTPIVPI